MLLPVILTIRNCITNILFIVKIIINYTLTERMQWHCKYTFHITNNELIFWQYLHIYFTQNTIQQCDFIQNGFRGMKHRSGQILFTAQTSMTKESVKREYKSTKPTQNIRRNE